MRLLKKRGTTPCDRRLDRRKVALAVVIAALFLSATAAQASTVNLAVDPTQSSLTLSWGWVNGPPGPLAPWFAYTGGPAGTVGFWPTPPSFIPESAQIFGSDTTTYSGTISMEQLSPTSIKFNTAGSSIVAAPNPNLPNTFAPNGFVGNYGLTEPSIGSDINITSSSFTFGAAALGNVPTPMAVTPGPNTFDLAGQLLQFATGDAWFTVYITGATINHEATAGIPSAFGTTLDATYLPNGLMANFAPYLGLLAPVPGIDVGTWDGVTLTVPFVTMMEIGIEHSDPSLGQLLIGISGQIVAVVVPEPSTMTLLGFGVVGLLSCAWRARKRKALAA